MHDRVRSTARIGRRRWWANVRPLMAVIAALALAALAPAAQAATLEVADDAAAPADAAALVRLVSVPRPELVTGGDVLLWSEREDVGISHGMAMPMRVQVTPGDGGFYYRLHPLPGGRVPLRLRAPGVPDGELVLQVSSAQGPLFAGPWEAPFVCQTAAFEIAPGLGKLPASTGPTCEVPRRTDHVWLLPDGRVEAQRPADGRATPVRLLTRVVNRAIAQVAVPVPGVDTVFTPGTRAAPWNGKLVYKFGGGCRGGWYRQGANTAGVLDPVLLAAGYAVASASLNVFGNNCNDLLAAETMAMVKEAFIEQVGPPVFTMGFGCSGGSYQGLQIADNQPGLLDGIVVGCVFPEVGQAMVVTLFDARLLQHYFETANAAAREGGAGPAWTEAEVLAVSGFASPANLRVAAEGAGRIDATPRTDRISAEFDPAVPEALRWHPRERPQGARATVFDHTVNVYGRDPVTGHARWPLDNRGVLYGLAAWRAGRIDGEHFVHLNEHVGGLDRDGEFVPARTRHDIEATRAAYATGRILDGGQGLATTPVIDYRAWADRLPAGDTHLAFHSASLRARLQRANGDAGNLVALQEDGSCADCPLFSLERPLLRGAVAAMDEWLTALHGGTPTVLAHASPAAQRSSGADVSPTDARRRAALRARVASTKPAALHDTCVVDGVALDTVPTAPDSACRAGFPQFSSPRLVAGAGIANDVVACARRPFDAAGFGTNERGEVLTPAQVARLRAAFPEGTCDYTQPGEGRVPHAGVWQSLGPVAPPASVPARPSEGAH